VAGICIMSPGRAPWIHSAREPWMPWISHSQGVKSVGRGMPVVPPLDWILIGTWTPSARERPGCSPNGGCALMLSLKSSTATIGSLPRSSIDRMS